jgi:hypothetical protein
VLTAGVVEDVTTALMLDGVAAFDMNAPMTASARTTKMMIRVRRLIFTKAALIWFM